MSLAISDKSLSPTLPFWVEDFGVADYETIWRLQLERVEQRLSGQRGNGVLIGEHFPIITLGRGSKPENILNPSIRTVSIERGGDVTYHGPGQIVVYPIMQLEEGGRDLHQYLRLLEQVVIETLAHYDIQGYRKEGYTGVWVKSAQGELKKICSIGVAVRRWVTYHGLSLNVNCDLTDYESINPCGLDRSVMTTLIANTEAEIDIQDVKAKLVQVFKTVHSAYYNS